jgi:hypothetical protein
VRHARVADRRRRCTAARRHVRRTTEAHADAAAAPERRASGVRRHVRVPTGHSLFLAVPDFRLRRDRASVCLAREEFGGERTRTLMAAGRSVTSVHMSGSVQGGITAAAVDGRRIRIPQGHTARGVWVVAPAGARRDRCIALKPLRHSTQASQHAHEGTRRCAGSAGTARWRGVTRAYLRECTRSAARAGPGGRAGPRAACATLASRIVVGAAPLHAGTSVRARPRPPTQRQRRNDAFAGARAQARTRRGARSAELRCVRCPQLVAAAGGELLSERALADVALRAATALHSALRPTCRPGAHLARSRRAHDGRHDGCRVVPLYGSFCLTRCVTRNGGCRRVAAAAASLHAWHDHTTSSTQSSLRSSSRRRAGTAFTASVRFSGASSGARAAGAGAPRFPSLHRHVVLHSATPVNLLTSAGVQDDGGAPPRSYASVSTPVPAGAVRRAGGRAGTAVRARGIPQGGAPPRSFPLRHTLRPSRSPRLRVR